MAKIPEYFATEQMETSRLPRAPVGQLADTGQGLEDIGLVGFGKALAGLGSDVLQNIINVRSESQLLEGTSQWERAHTVFFTGLAKDRDFENYGIKYKAFAKSLRRQILQKKLTTPARRDLEGYMENQQVSKEKHLAGMFLTEQRDFGRVSAFESVIKFERAEDFDGAISAINRAQTIGFMSREEAFYRKQKVQGNIESNQIQKLIFDSPELAIKKIDASTLLNEKEKNILRSQVGAAIARREREQAVQLQAKQEEVNISMLADYWDGKLTDPQKITDALRAGYLDDTDAKYLRNAIMNPDSPTLNLQNLAIVKRAIEDIGTTTKTTQQALSVLYENLDSIDPATGKSLLNEIFSKQDKNISEMKRESRTLMEELIRDRDKFTGMFTDDERQILASAEAYLMLDTEIQKAVEADKPLERRDIMIKAIQIGRQMKAKIKQEEKEKTLPEFRPTIEGQVAPRATGTKGALAKPDFTLDAEGEPEKVFDSKGVEIGIRRKQGQVFRIGYHVMIGGRKYEYIGNGNFEEVK